MGDSRQSRAALALVPASFHDEDDEDEGCAAAPFDIHAHFGLPPERPICLDSLDDPPAGAKPVYTYATLVKLAIWSSPQRRLTLAGIYQALEQRFVWFRECANPNPWKTSIRHTLSLLAVFVKLPLDLHMPGKGCFWTVDFTKGDGYKRPRKRGPASKKSSSSAAGANHTPRTRPRPASQAPLANPMPAPKPGGVPESGWDVQPQPQRQLSMQEMQGEWQVSEEAERRVFVPNQQSVQVGAPSPDPQFRHYRMSTFLYPEGLAGAGDSSGGGSGNGNGAGPSTHSPTSTASSSQLHSDGAAAAAAGVAERGSAGVGAKRRTRTTQRANPVPARKNASRPSRSNGRGKAPTPASVDHRTEGSPLHADSFTDPPPSGSYAFRAEVPLPPQPYGSVPDITALRPHQLVEIASAPGFNAWGAPLPASHVFDRIDQAPMIDPALLA